ncbi:MAG: type II toxin-antitoxin system VapC family toxin [Steroidobacteraceae bacterium]
MIVVDASALLETVLQAKLADQLMHRLFEALASLHAPHLLDVELTQSLRRLAQRKDISVERAAQGLVDCSEMHIERHSHQALLTRMAIEQESTSSRRNTSSCGIRNSFRI